MLSDYLILGNGIAINTGSQVNPLRIVLNEIPTILSYSDPILLSLKHKPIDVTLYLNGLRLTTPLDFTFNNTDNKLYLNSYYSTLPQDSNFIADYIYIPI